jgi:hypothetical protein
MTSKIKRLLLLANILLLIFICFFVVKSLNGRASEIAIKRISKVCDHIVTEMDNGAMSLAQAAEYTAQASRTGEYVPTVEVFKGADGVIVETNDPSIMVNVLKKKETKFARVNCSQLAQG